MPSLVPHQLTEKKISKLKDGNHCDGGNLYLVVRGESRAWTFRFKSPTTKKVRQMSLGTLPDTTLIEARDRARKCRYLLSEDLDPLQQKRSNRLKLENERVLFKEAAEAYIKAKHRQWRGQNTKKGIESLLSKYAYPSFEDRDIASITLDDVLNLLTPIWHEKTITATKIQGVLDRIIQYSIAKGWFKGENPARWGGYLANLLPKPSLITTVTHRKAYDWKKMSILYNRLKQDDDIASLAIRFICLTASRSTEVRELTLKEIDLTAALWTLPASRSKTNQELKLPLPDEAMDIIYKVMNYPRKTDYLFEVDSKPVTPKKLLNTMKSVSGDEDMTIHGLRSSFNDWAGEATDIPYEIYEEILGHSKRSKVQAAYRRGDSLDKRKNALDQWAAYCLEQS